MESKHLKSLKSHWMRTQTIEHKCCKSAPNLTVNYRLYSDMCSPKRDFKYLKLLSIRPKFIRGYELEL